METNRLKYIPANVLAETFQKERNTSEAWAEVYRRYNQRVFHFCLKMGLGREDALDMTQEIFLKVYKSIHTLNKPQAFESWLFRIVHNECVNLIRVRNKHYTSSLDSMSFEQVVETNEVIQKKEQSKLHKYRQVNMIIEELPLETKNLLFFKYLDNYPLKRLEKLYDLKESAIKMRLLRAKRKVQRAFESLPSTA